ncbi:MAG: FMN-binding protein [Clostridia bacterium]
MGKALRLVGVLTVICVISALLLSYVYNDVAAPAIAAREKEEAISVVKEIVPDADDYEIVQDDNGKIKHYEVIVDGKVEQVAIPAEATGFAGPVKLLVVTDMDGKITGVSVAGQSETPGYGDKILTEPWFIEQFEGMSLIENEFVVGSDIDALAGATVTSGAAGRAVQNAAEYFMVNFMEGMEEELAEQERQDAYDSMKELLPDADDFDYVSNEDGETLYYTALQEGEVYAYGFITESKGLNGPVVILTVTDTEGVIIDNKVISQVDTPDYGDRIIDEPEFMEQFIDMSLSEDTFAIGDTIDGLSGATVTSTGATKAVANAANIWEEHLGDGTSANQENGVSEEESTEEGSTKEDSEEDYDISSLMDEHLEQISEYEKEKVDEGTYYLAKSDDQTQAIGILTKAEGMQSDIVMLTITDIDGNVIDLVVVDQDDTPSLGDQIITEEWFTDQYQGLSLVDCSFEVGSDIDVIASVTITSEAANEAVIKASEIFKDYIMEGAGQ